MSGWLVLVMFALLNWRLAGSPPIWRRSYWYLGRQCGWCGMRTIDGDEWLCERCISAGRSEWP